MFTNYKTWLKATQPFYQFLLWSCTASYFQYYQLSFLSFLSSSFLTDQLKASSRLCVYMDPLFLTLICNPVTSSLTEVAHTWQTRVGNRHLLYTLARLYVFTVKHTKMIWATWLLMCCCKLARSQASHLHKKHKLRALFI